MRDKENALRRVLGSVAAEADQSATDPHSSVSDQTFWNADPSQIQTDDGLTNAEPFQIFGALSANADPFHTLRSGIRAPHRGRRQPQRPAACRR